MQHDALLLTCGRIQGRKRHCSLLDPSQHGSLAPRKRGRTHLLSASYLIPAPKLSFSQALTDPRAGRWNWQGGAERKQSWRAPPQSLRGFCLSIFLGQNTRRRLVLPRNTARSRARFSHLLCLRQCHLPKGGCSLLLPPKSLPSYPVFFCKFHNWHNNILPADIAKFHRSTAPFHIRGSKQPQSAVACFPSSRTSKI